MTDISASQERSSSLKGQIPRWRIWTAIQFLLRLFVGCLFCLTPVTAVVVLGWLQRLIRRVALRRLTINIAPSDPRFDELVPHADRGGWPQWFARAESTGRFSRIFGSLKSNIAEGAGALLSLAIATAPFTLLWLFSWWAGWENSFNKGYEQSWVGPVTGLAAVFLAINVLAYLPMALVHQAIEMRWQSLFQIKRVRALIATAGWRYIALSLMFVVAGLPLFAAQGLPVFIEKIVPDFDASSPEQVEAIAGRFRLLTAIYIFLALVILRSLSARVYAHAVQKSFRADDKQLWAGSRVENLLNHLTDKRTRSPARFTRRLWRIIQTCLLWVIWFGLVAQIFVAQFLNYQWWSWISHPFFLLPWTR